jgi:hypothetical protein
MKNTIYWVFGIKIDKRLFADDWNIFVLSSMDIFVEKVLEIEF